MTLPQCKITAGSWNTGSAVHGLRQRFVPIIHGVGRGQELG